MITIVSGWPRSGTSLMLQMLQAGGLEILEDDQRPPDEHNPRGYFELQAVKRIRADSRWLDQAEGRALKLIAVFLEALPATHVYTVFFMRRDWQAMLASQHRLREALGQPPAASDDELLTTYQRETARILAWCRGQTKLRLQEIQFEKLFQDPAAELSVIKPWLPGLDPNAMAAVIDPGLRHHP